MRKYLRYKSKTLKTDDNVEIFYKILKPGKNNKEKKYLFFIHGMFANHTVFKKEADYFGRREYGIILLDLRGHGKSSKPYNKEKYKTKYQASDIHKIIKKENINYLTLIGHSYGGIIAAAAYPKLKEKVDKMILVDSPVNDPFHMFNPKIKKLLDKEWRAFFTIYHNLTNLGNINEKKFNMDVNFNKKKISNALGTIGFAHMPKYAVEGTWENVFNLNSKKIFSKVDCPCLAIIGTKDYVAWFTQANKIKKYLKDLTIEHIEANHYMTVKKSRKIEKLISKFIKTN